MILMIIVKIKQSFQKKFNFFHSVENIHKDNKFKLLKLLKIIKDKVIKVGIELRIN